MIKDCVDLVTRFEGFSPVPYLCPAGVWTIGYGTTRYPDGVRVRENDIACSQDHAREWLNHELLKCEQAVIRYCKPHLNEKQRAALVSFVYNLGSGAFRASTLRRRINAGDWDDVPYQIGRWNKAGGRILKGLVIRRQAEIQLWNEGVDLVVKQKYYRCHHGSY